MMKALLAILILSFVFTDTITAQLKPKKFSENYQALAQQETNTMKQRYKLSAAQLAKIEKLNADYYHQINAALRDTRDLAVRKERVGRIRAAREKQLQGLFTKEQYSAYRKDMDAVELKARQRIKELNENARQRKVRVAN